jgi:hypothetical protein
MRRVLELELGVPYEEVAAIFSALDSSRDGKVRYSDFLAAVVVPRLEMHDALIFRAFRRFDASNVGRISLKNLGEVLGESFEAKEVEGIFAEVPHHRSGAIDFSEFKHYLQNVTSLSIAAKSIDPAGGDVWAVPRETALDDWTVPQSPRPSHGSRDGETDEWPSAPNLICMKPSDLAEESERFESLFESVRILKASPRRPCWPSSFTNNFRTIPTPVGDTSPPCP